MASRIALISMPWQDPFSPSIQLGTLASYVHKMRPDVEVDTYELFLDLADAIDIHVAKRISISWIGEALFAYLLFPSQAASISNYLEHSRKDDPAFAHLDFGAVIERLRVALLNKLNSVDWSQYRMVGLSVVFAQMVPSLLAAKEIKKRALGVPIVLGGPSCTNLIGKSLLEAFDFLDYVVNGEGERPLVNLIDALEKSDGSPVDVRAVVHRGSAPEAFGAIDQIENMAEIPAPSFDGYFSTLSKLPRATEIKGRVRLPYETSRGCWWDRSHVDPMLSCTFCNLNLQWHSYREKPVDQSLDEMSALASTYECPDLTLVDNILRYKAVDEFIQGLIDRDRALDLWIEARASVKPDQVRRLGEAGARVIQFGIESLSSSMLKKIVKGTTAIQNIQAMKFCEQYGVKNTANLIIDFPGTDESDIFDTLENIEFARAYYPLSTTEFSLVYQAPAYKAPEKFGIENVRNYHMYEMLLPPDLYERLFLTEKSYDSVEVTRLRPLWKRVREAAQAWEAHYHRMRTVVEGGLLLSMQDAGEYLKIRDFRGLEPKFTWIRGVERDVYLECREIISRTDLAKRFPSVPPAEIDDAIARWRSARLMFVEEKKLLSLAMPWGPVSARRVVEPVRTRATLTVVDAAV